MVSGRLQEKKGYFYVVLSYVDKEGKRKQPWFKTGLKVHGNKRKADEILAEIKKNFNIETGKLNSEEIKLDEIDLFIKDVEVNSTDKVVLKSMIKEIFFDEWFESYASGKQREEYDIYVDEVSLGELIDTEERMLRNRLIYKYASESFGDMTVQEFSRIMQDDDSEEKNRMYYEGVKNLLKSLRLSEYIEERLDTSKMTHAEFLKIKDQLCSAKIGDEFEKINREAIEKYGKVGVYD